MTDGAGAALLGLLGAWNEADADARDAILDGALGASFTYEDPNAPAPLDGRDGLSGYLATFRDSLPDVVLLPIGAPQVTHGTAMVRARLDRAGAPFAEMRFVGRMGADGLSHLAAFVESE